MFCQARPTYFLVLTYRLWLQPADGFLFAFTQLMLLTSNRVVIKYHHYR